eukprot:1524259-Pyramimonas_sp.AAC.2
MSLAAEVCDRGSTSEASIADLVHNPSPQAAAHSGMECCHRSYASRRLHVPGLCCATATPSQMSNTDTPSRVLAFDCISQSNVANAVL